MAENVTTDNGASADWRQHLVRQLDIMGPWPRGRYVPDPDRTSELVPAERLHDAGYLHRAILRARPAGADAANPNDRDPRIAVSRMTRQYCASLTCVALAGLANGVGIDLSPGRCRMIYERDVPFRVTLPEREPPLRCARRPTTWPVDGPAVDTVERLRERVWTSLYAENLGPLFATAVGMVNVPERFLWTNAAEWVAMIMESAVDHLPPAQAHPVVTECLALLDAVSLPGFPDGTNPLRGLLTWQPFDGEPEPGVQTRHLCCLAYLHSDRFGRLCQNCPVLPLPDRVALLRERRAAGVTKSDGPAERRSIEVGVTRALARRTRQLTG